MNTPNINHLVITETMVVHRPAVPSPEPEIGLTACGKPFDTENDIGYFAKPLIFGYYCPFCYPNQEATNE